MNKIVQSIKETVTSPINVIIAVSLFIISFSISRCYHYKVEAEKKENTISTITKKFEKKGNGGKVDVIETNVKDFKDVKTDDPELIELREIVKKQAKQLKNRGSVTLINDSVKYDTSYIKKTDTLKLAGNVNYIDTISNEFIHSTFGRKGDTVLYSLSLNNKQTLVFKEEGSLFEKKKLVLTIENSNKYFNTTSARTVSTYDLKQSKLGLGGHLGMGITKGMKLTPVLSIGINYNFVNF